ncbi:MAG: AzlD domain-containing protein [Halarcobacter ebronensis]
MSSMELYIAIAIMAVVNFLTRVFPFVFFAKKIYPSQWSLLKSFSRNYYDYFGFLYFERC